MQQTHKMGCEVQIGERMVLMGTKYTGARVLLCKNTETRALRREVWDKDLRKGTEINWGDGGWPLGQENKEFKQEVPRRIWELGFGNLMDSRLG